MDKSLSSYLAYAVPVSFDKVSLVLHDHKETTTHQLTMCGLTQTLNFVIEQVNPRTSIT